MLDSNRVVDVKRIQAWQAGTDLQIVVPVEYARSPFDPVCCLTMVRLDLLLSPPQGMPEKVTVQVAYSKPIIKAAKSLVPQR